MTERGFPMHGHEVRAVNDGRMTQVRRAVKLPGWFVDEYGPAQSRSVGAYEIKAEIACPYGVPGDRLWVKEAWSDHHPADGQIWFKADNDGRTPERWKSPIHMPREYSRIKLEVVNIRVERLQDISEADARASGIRLSLEDDLAYHREVDRLTNGGMSTISATRAAFGFLWDSTAKPGREWNANPWVWRGEFRRVA